MTRRRPHSTARAIAMLAVPLLLLAQVSFAGEALKPTPKTDAKADPKAAAAAAPKSGSGHAARASLGGPMAVSLPGIDLPAYQPPDAYSVDLVIHSPEGEMVMKRYIDNGRTRTELNASGNDIVMIEMGDEKGTSYTLMPGDKRAIKTSLVGMQEMAGKRMPKKAKEEQAAQAAAPPDVKVEDLGDETIDGRAVKKVRMSIAEGSALGWFDKTNGAPVRMESTVDGKKTAMEWKDYKVGPQPAKLFEIPKGYEVTDMEEMMSKMKGAGGMGMPGMGGLGGMAGGMAGNMASGMAQNFGESMGGSLGSSLGGAFGGPIGAIAGQYLGGKIGGMIAKKTADAVIPGKQP